MPNTTMAHSTKAMSVEQALRDKNRMLESESVKLKMYLGERESEVQINTHNIHNVPHKLRALVWIPKKLLSSFPLSPLAMHHYKQLSTQTTQNTHTLQQLY